MREARFKNSFIFKYSGRPGTKADELYVDDVPEATKRRRNNELLAIQNAISLEDNQPFLGRTVEILVEGPSKVAKKRDPEQAARQRKTRSSSTSRPRRLPMQWGAPSTLALSRRARGHATRGPNDLRPHRRL